MGMVASQGKQGFGRRSASIRYNAYPFFIPAADALFRILLEVILLIHIDPAQAVDPGFDVPPGDDEGDALVVSTTFLPRLLQRVGKLASPLLHRPGVGIDMDHQRSCHQAATKLVDLRRILGTHILLSGPLPCGRRQESYVPHASQLSDVSLKEQAGGGVLRQHHAQGTARLQRISPRAANSDAGNMVFGGTWNFSTIAMPDSSRLNTIP